VATTVPETENCSRCGRPYSEHLHSGAEYIEITNAAERFHAHAFRRQPASKSSPGGLRIRINDWRAPAWWPDGRWDR